MTDIKTMSPATGEVITKTGEVVNLVDVLGGATPVDETVYDIESYSPRTGLIIGSDGRVYDLVDLLQGGSGPSGDCVTKEELEEKFTEKLQPIQDSVSTSEGKVSAMEGKVATCESKVVAIEKKVDGMDAVSIDMVEDLQEQLDKSEAKVDALWKLNQGQTYDFKEEIETSTSDAPAGAHYMSLEEVQGDTRQDNYHMGLAVDAGTVEGCAEAPIRELQMFGKTEQASTNGYNLLPTWDIKSQTQNGITLTNHGDGSYTITGAYSTYTQFLDYDEEGFELEAGTYTLYGAVGCQLRSQNGGTTYAAIIDGYLSTAFTLPEKTMVKFRQTISGESMFRAVNGMTLRPALVAGSGTKEWEPYTGGIPSPNPDYPQEINPLEEINVKVCGKNLCATKGYDAKSNLAISAWLKANVTYTISFDLVSFTSSTMEIWGCNFRKNAQMGGAVGSITNMVPGNRYSTRLISDEDCRVFINGYANASIDNIQLEVGEVATDYEPYREQIIKVTPPKPLMQVGDSTDICDVENGVWLYAVGALNLGDRAWTSNYTVAKWAQTNGIRFIKLNSTACLCREYTNDPDSSVTFMKVPSVGLRPTYNDPTTMRILVTDDRIADLSSQEIKQLLDGVIVYYEAATPEVVPIHTDALALLRSLKTYAGATNVFITDQSGRDVSSHFRFLRGESYQRDDAVSPTPLYPSALHPIEEINVKVAGKNLAIDPNLPTVTAPYYILGYVGADSLEPDTTYTISFEGGVAGDQVYLSENLFTTSPTINLAGANPRKTVTVTTVSVLDKNKNAQYDPAKGWKIIKSRTVAGASITLAKLQIELGEITTEYVDPIDLQTRTITPPRPMNSIGEHRDVCDVESGVWHYATKMHEVTADEKLLSVQPSYNGNIGRAHFVVADAYKYNSDGARHFDLVSSHFVARAGDTEGTIFTYTASSVNSSPQIFMYLKDERLTDTEIFLEWLSNLSEPLVIVYRLQNEENYPIDPDDLAFLRSLELLPADHHITITDQDGNDVSYLMEYIIKLSEVVS